MQRAEDQVAGLGGRDGRGDRLLVAHLADEDHVGVLAQGAPQALGEGRDVDADLTLVDDGLLVVVVVLDRVLDRDDVDVVVRVDVVQHRGQGGRLAAARRARDQHQAARPVAQIADGLRQPDLVEGEQPVGDQPGDERRVPALPEDRAAEAGALAVGLAEVGAPLLAELRQHALRRDLLHESHGVPGLEHRVPHVLQAAAPAQDGWTPHRDVDVRGVLFDHQVEELGHVDRHRVLRLHHAARDAQYFIH